MGNRVRWRNGESTTSFDDLPSEMAVNILSRLPVKSLLRSTSVSKTWYSVIVNQNFISSQITHSISSCDKNAVLIVPTCLSHQNYCSLVSAETGHVFDKYEIPFNTKSGTLTLLDSVNGLLFLSDLGSFKDLYLWNPSLRKYKYLDSTCLPDDLFRDWKIRSYVVKLGFHEPTHDYRVVRIVQCADEKGNLVEEVASKVEVFSLRMNKWREIQSPIVPRVTSLDPCTIVNGITYWLATNSPQTFSEEMWILSFDFNKEVFGQLKLPDDVRYCFGETPYFQLMQFERSLSVCVFYLSASSNKMTEPCCIWLMRNEDGIISWTRRFSFVLKEFGLPLKITKSGALIMLTCSSNTSPVRSIMSCNLKSMQCKYLGFNNSFDEKVKLPATVDVSFIESLVMHAGGEEIDR